MREAAVVEMEPINVSTVNETKVNRAKVVGITIELELPSGEILVLDDLDFCTPGGFYNGVEALVFGDEAVKVMQAGMSALYPKVGDSVSQMWNNKVNPEDPRLPTFLMIKPPENKLSKTKGGANKSYSGVFRSSAKVKAVGNAPVLMATCGGYNHPQGRGS